jgi:hypothetical protein
VPAIPKLARGAFCGIGIDVGDHHRRSARASSDAIFLPRPAPAPVTTATSPSRPNVSSRHRFPWWSILLNWLWLVLVTADQGEGSEGEHEDRQEAGGHERRSRHWRYDTDHDSD